MGIGGEGIARRRGHSIEEAATHWRLVHEVLDEDLPHLEQYLVIRYEDFCARPLSVLNEVQQFLGLDQAFDTSLAIREFNAHNMNGKPEKLQDFNARSVKRLSYEDIATITRVAGDQMMRWKYQPMGSPAP